MLEMIENFGIGIDLSNIERFKKKSFETNKDFYKKIFTQKEILYCLKFKNSYDRFAGKFALKEAVIKALNQKIDFLEIETLHKNDSPYVNLKNFPNYLSKSSISHEKNIAVAVFLVEF